MRHSYHWITNIAFSQKKVYPPVFSLSTPTRINFTQEIEVLNFDKFDKCVHRLFVMNCFPNFQFRLEFYITHEWTRTFPFFLLLLTGCVCTIHYLFFPSKRFNTGYPGREISFVVVSSIHLSCCGIRFFHLRWFAGDDGLLVEKFRVVLIL